MASKSSKLVFEPNFHTLCGLNVPLLNVPSFARAASNNCDASPLRNEDTNSISADLFLSFEYLKLERVSFIVNCLSPEPFNLPHEIAELEKNPNSRRNPKLKHKLNRLRNQATQNLIHFLRKKNILKFMKFWKN